MATLTNTQIGTLIERLKALGVRAGVYVMPAGTRVPECRYRDHNTLEPIPAVVTLYPRDEDDDTTELCLACAVHIATETDVRAVDVMRFDGDPIIETVPDEAPVDPPNRVAIVDRDGRFASVERVGVELELRITGNAALMLDLSTPTGLAAARVLRAQLDAAIAQVA